MTVTATVLVIDDDAEVRGLVAGLLKRSGYSVLEAGSGSEGIRRAEEACPDLVLLDMAMPDLDGLQVARAIRSKASLAETPVVALTARHLASDRRRALEAGCSHFLTKPCPPAELRAAIDGILGLPRASVRPC